MNRAWALTLLVLTCATSALGAAPQFAGTAPLEDKALEDRVQALGKQLRCAVCQGLSIADSPASMARAQLDVVRTLVQEGKSDAEVKQFFVERYGEWALLEPKKTSSNLLLWLGPVALVLGGLAFILFYATRQKAPKDAAATGGGAAAASGSAPPSTDDEYLKAVRAELEK